MSSWEPGGARLSACVAMLQMPAIRRSVSTEVDLNCPVIAVVF